MWLIVTIIICKDFYLRGKEERELKTYKSYPSDHKAESWTEIKSCDFLSFSFSSILFSFVFCLCLRRKVCFQGSVLHLKPPPTEDHFSHQLAYSSRNEERNDFEYGVVSCRISFLEQKERWSTTVLQTGVQHSFSLQWPDHAPVHPVEEESKTTSPELSDLVSSLPVLGLRDPEMFSEICWCFPTLDFNKRSSKGDSGVQDVYTWTLVRREGREREKTMCQQQGLHLLYLNKSLNNYSV